MRDFLHFRVQFYGLLKYIYSNNLSYFTNTKITTAKTTQIHINMYKKKIKWHISFGGFFLRYSVCFGFGNGYKFIIVIQKCHLVNGGDKHFQDSQNTLK